MSSYDGTAIAGPSSDSNPAPVPKPISATSMQVPDATIQLAKTVFERTSSKHQLRKPFLQALIPACIFQACRQHHIARSVRECLRHKVVSRKHFFDAFKKVQAATESATSHTGWDITQFCTRWCSQLNFSENTSRVAGLVAETMKHAEREVATGKLDPTLAAAAVYVAAQLCGEVQDSKKIPAKRVSEVCGITPSTISEARREFIEKKGVDWVSAEMVRLGADVKKV